MSCGSYNGLYLIVTYAKNQSAPSISHGLLLGIPCLLRLSVYHYFTVSVKVKELSPARDAWNPLYSCVTTTYLKIRIWLHRRIVPLNTWWHPLRMPSMAQTSNPASPTTHAPTSDPVSGHRKTLWFWFSSYIPIHEYDSWGPVYNAPIQKRLQSVKHMHSTMGCNVDGSFLSMGDYADINNTIRVFGVWDPAHCFTFLCSRVYPPGGIPRYHSKHNTTKRNGTKFHSRPKHGINQYVVSAYLDFSIICKALSSTIEYWLL